SASIPSSPVFRADRQFFSIGSLPRVAISTETTGRYGSPWDDCWGWLSGLNEALLSDDGSISPRLEGFELGADQTHWHAAVLRVVERLLQDVPHVVPVVRVLQLHLAAQDEAHGRREEPHHPRGPVRRDPHRVPRLDRQPGRL